MNQEENIPQENSKEQSQKSSAPDSKREEKTSISQDFPEDSNAPEQHQILHPEFQTPNMETHAHHLHKAPSNGWKHFLFEFLMLFLAVFCGFLAENQREHMVEHQREKGYMRSMAEDLIKDIQLLENESARTTLQCSGLDTLVQIINAGNLEQEQIRKMYILQERFLYPLTLELVSRTEVQLKNAGAMRLIRKQVVNDSLINYWQLRDRIVYTREAINGHRIKAKDLSFILFDNKYYSRTGFGLDSTEKNMSLLPHAEAVLIEFGNRVSHTRKLLQFNYNTRLDVLIVTAHRLIELIKKEYHLQ